MADRSRSRWTYRVLFVAMSAAVAFVKLVPGEAVPGVLPGPDILLLLALSWVVMRPDFVPVWLVAAVFLSADILFMRPPGLWAALVIVATEFLRVRNAALRDAPFVGEWLIVGTVVAAMTLVNAAILAVFLVSQPAFGMTLLRLVVTVLAYPLVVILAGRALGVRRPTAAEADRMGLKA